MEISVAIPVFNAANYVREAVESALAQPETAEVILIEDGSPDDSLSQCEMLAQEYPIVHLHRHPNGENRGAGVSRNLAIEKCAYDYVAFLDADDFYLPGRFEVAKKIFEDSPDVEGVYEAVGTHFEDERTKTQWQRIDRPLITTVSESVEPRRLFEAMVIEGKGHFHLDGLVVKRMVFEQTGMFDDLRLHQDTVMMSKMAALTILVPGRLVEPVAMRRVHDHNRISAPSPNSERYRARMRMWSTLWFWSKQRLHKERQQMILSAWLTYALYYSRFDIPSNRVLRHLLSRIQLLLLVRDFPALAGEISYWKRFMPRVRYYWGFLQKDHL